MDKIKVLLSIISRLMPQLCIIIFVILFFSHLFYPHLSLFSTPDFGQSDIWQLNLPLKYFLSTSLKDGQWPVWNPYIGNGFPSLAEGQTGTFNIINLLLFRFFPFVIAYNLGYITIFLTSALGTYLYCQTIRLSKISSFFSSIIFAFSGFFIAHTSHFNLIQASSLLPWLFLATDKFLHSTRLKSRIFWGSTLSFVLSQQMFAGFPQITFITLIAIILYFFFYLLSFKNRNSGTKIKSLYLILFAFFIFLGFAASAIQFIPQKEFLDTSTRSGGFSGEFATYFSYPFKHIITMIFPYALGDPRRGTYPPFQNNDGSIFWENTGYIGWIPLVLAIVSLTNIRKVHKVRFYVLLLIFSFLLMTGKYSPLYFIFPLPPFSYFRVPSRFIILFVWSLCILAAYGLEQISTIFDIARGQRLRGKFFRLLHFVRKDKLKGIIAIIAIIQLFSFALFYNPISSAEKVMEKPEVIKYLNPLNEHKIYSYGSIPFWNNIFYQEGWQHNEKYLYYKNALSANQNVVYNIPSLNLYRAQTTRRYDILINNLILSDINYPTFIATPSSLFVNLLRTFGVNRFITQYNLINTNYISLVTNLPVQYGIQPFSVYEIKDPLPNIYLTDNYKQISYIPELFATLQKSETLDHKVALIERPLALLPKDNSTLKYEIKKSSRSNLSLKLDVVSNKKAILIFNNSYYPGWNVLVDGNAQTIFPVNLDQIGVIMDKGEHKVIFTYQPYSFLWGKRLTIGSHILLSFIFILSMRISTSGQRRRHL